MGCRLIINADDFGLTRGINRAVAELHQAGVLSSATLMASGPAFQDAVAVATSLPALGVGCHVVLVDGTPVSPTGEISSLLGDDRRTFRPTLSSFVRDLFLGRIRESEIAHEAEAQIRKLQRSGIRVTHVDTHKHAHLFPRVARPLLAAATRCAVPTIRYPFEPHWSITAAPHASQMRLLQLAALRFFEPSFSRLTPSVNTPKGTLGIAATGTLKPAALRSILAALPTDHDAVYELLCHPGYNDKDLAQTATRLRAQREIEHRALLSEVLRALALPHAPTLIHYGHITPPAS